MPVLPDWVSFQFPPKIHIEPDCSHKVGDFVKEIGRRVILITTQKEMQNTNELANIKSSIEKSTDGIIVYDDIQNKVTFKDLNTGAHFARQAQGDCIIAYGGIEAVSAAKAIALLVSNDMFAEDLMHQSKLLKKKALPLVIIPTTPLMGLECSPFCVITDENEQTRKYFSNQYLFPDLIITDSKIGSFMSSSDIAKVATGILAASMDTVLSKFANDITMSSSLRAIELISKNIIASIRDPKNMQAKNNIYAASLLVGISQSVSSLGLCFALSLAASSLTKIDIFQAMSILLPHVMEYNLTSSANKYVLVARALDEDITDISIIEAAIKAVEGIRKIYNELKIPQKLAEYEIKKSELSAIAAMSLQYSFLDSLPRELPKNEIETILGAAY